MNEVAVCVTAALFALAVFPVHVYNYIYLDTGKKYASINAGVYGVINIFNANTVSDNPREMQVNGKNKKIDPTRIKYFFYKIFNCLCLYKVVQLGDYGMQKEGNAYVALVQSCFTTTIYKFIQCNGNYCKLRNYSVLNEEHSEIRYYAKAVTVINLLVAAKILIIILKEKIHDAKNKKK